MSDFKVTPQSDLTTSEMLERYNLDDEITLKRWTQLHGIDNSRGYYNPDEVDLIDHVHHHIYNLGMSIIDYQSFIDRRQISPQQFTQENDKNMMENNIDTNVSNSQQKDQSTENFVCNDYDAINNNSEEINNEEYAAIEMLKKQYSEAIDLMGEQIADHFIDELDLSVMRHLVKKVKERQRLNGKVSSNRFLKTIKAVLQPQNGNFLVPQDKNNESSMELEQNHRLG
ncbi:MAG: hypothetical protein F6K54_13145 [Okeania sp. SIO3B5]|uniref:hypothetical protein n=1 Tax=Okeania sp. SIO3B5 TaxID=2607811 RepID=UPI0014009CDB|nr:hypothetical protein [Okeania sp. SIO3B5]NEO53940.1 hypothetical protein [Okeania sp. SIO3B5]